MQAWRKFHCSATCQSLASTEVARSWLLNAETTVSRWRRERQPSIATQFSRSSGAGGQNVNKVNSKASLRILDIADPRLAIPADVQQIIKRAPECQKLLFDSKGALRIDSQRFRTQSENLEECYRKLSSLLYELASEIAAPTSSQKLENIKVRKSAANERRIQMKKLVSAKKSSRKGGNNDS